MCAPQVSLTPLNAAGNWVPGIWTGAANVANTYENYVECPRDVGTKIRPVDGTGAATSNAAFIRAAIAKAFEGHVYGFDTSGEAGRTAG